MRLLEVQGLLSIRPGPGGVVVGAALPANLGRSLILHMQFVGATYDELMETCIWSEGQLAELAAGNRDRRKVRQLMSPFLGPPASGRPGGESLHTVEEGLNFHLAVGALVENRVRAFMLMMPGQVLVEHITGNVERHYLEDPFVHDHEAIAGAIIAGSAARAGKLMRAHFQDINKYFRTYWPRAVADKIQGR
jgi:DNA-binding FadR family transcriptional regulator